MSNTGSNVLTKSPEYDISAVKTELEHMQLMENTNNGDFMERKTCDLAESEIGNTKHSINNDNSIFQEESKLENLKENNSEIQSDESKPSLKALVPVCKQSKPAPVLDFSNKSINSSVTRPIPSKDVLFVHPILTESQIQTLKDFTDEHATFWHEDENNKAYRNAYTVEFYHHELAKLIFDHVKNELPQTLSIDRNDEFEHLIAAGEWVIDSVPDRLLLAKYNPGGHFSPHTDGNCVHDFNHRTLYSIIIYLSECEGGETAFYEYDALKKMIQIDNIWRIPTEYELHKVTPEGGKCLVFRQTLVHEGCPIIDGVKYIIRSDVMYRRKELKYDTEAGRLAWEYYEKYEEACNDGKIQLALECWRKSHRACHDLAEDCGLSDVH